MQDQKIKEKIELRLKPKKGPSITTTNEKKRLKNKGININAKGIKILKFSSNVREFVIQCNPLK